MQYINQKYLNDESLSRDEFLKRAWLWGAAVSSLSLFDLACGKNGIDPVFSKKTEDIVPVYPQPIIKNNKVLLTNLAITQYQSPSYELYSLPMKHDDGHDAVKILQELIPAIDSIRKQGKQVVVLLEGTPNMSLPLERVKEFYESTKLKNSFELFQEQTRYKDNLSQYLSYYKEIETEMSITLSGGKNKIFGNDSIDSYLLKAMQSKKVNIYYEQCPPEANLLGLVFKYLTAMATQLLQKGDRRLLEYLPAINYYGYLSYDQRNVRMLERGYRLSKSLNAVPIIVMGFDHNLKNVSGAKKLNFIDKNQYKPQYKNAFAWIVESFLNGYFYSMGVSRGVNPYEYSMALYEIGNKITDAHVLNLLADYRKAKIRISENELNNRFSTQALQILLNWLSKVVDPKKEAKIWNLIN